MTLPGACSRFRPRPQEGAHPGRRAGILAGALAVALLGPGCQRPAATDERPPAREAPAAAAPEAPIEPAWRTLAVLREHLGEGVAVAPVLEAVDDLRGEARLMVAVHRAGPEPALTVELWTLRSGGPKAIYAPVGAGEAILRLREGDARSRGLDPLRRFMATPGTAVIRPRGVGRTPDALLEALTRALREADDPGAAGQARADAIATLLRGLDDALVLERDRALEAIAALRGGGAIVERAPLGARRSRVTLAGPPKASLLLFSLADGWVVAEIDDQGAASGSTEPAAEPSPTAP